MKKVPDYVANEISKKVEKELKVKFNNHNGYLYDVAGYWEISNENKLVRAVYALYKSSDQHFLSDKAVRDALKRLSNTTENQITFCDKDNLINLKNGVFDVEKGELLKNVTDLNFSYQLNFEFVPKAELKDAPTFQMFIERAFPEEKDLKVKLLLQAMAYGLSDYKKAKTAFFYIGKSNSGKSTILELQEKIMPKGTITAIPLYRLNNRFNVARLHGAKMNICTEIRENSFAALDMFKAMASNEVVTAEHKGEKPFEFRILCKSFNAGNMLPSIDEVEGMDAIINRMTILFFPISVPAEEQDRNLLDKLWEERNIIFSLALKELKILKDNNFIFPEPSDSKYAKEQMKAKARAFDDFVEDCCSLEDNAKEHTYTLYEAFRKYCIENLLDVKITKAQFSQRISCIPGVIRSKFRIGNSNARWGVEGLKLKDNSL